MENMAILSKFQSHIVEKQAERYLIQKELATIESEITTERENYDNLIKARFILAEVAKLTQTKFTSYVEQLVTMAIKSIFDRPFQFKVDFDLKRNKSECFLRIQEGEDEEPFVPKDELGGGMLDTISFALRIVLWSLQNPRSSNTILLDEPFHFLGDLSERACSLVKEISSRLNIQFIITTHNESLSSIADKAWRVTNEDGLSKVTLIVGEEDKPILKRKRLTNP
jgi:DNA repair exonuclease SbcCD ATPase subunit